MTAEIKKYSEINEENSHDSIKAYFRYLDQIPLKDQYVLDLGCCDGHDLSRIKTKGAHIYGIDILDEMVKLSKKNNPEGTFKIGFFDEIPFPDHTFDLVISKWSFQNAAEIDPIYYEVNRVLKPGGQFLFLASHPFRQFLEKKRKGKDYFKKEIVETTFFNGQLTEHAPSHTLNEYLSPLFFKTFTLEAFEEANAEGAETIDGDIYPSYFIVKAKRCH